jgi:membrane-associated phospholipid phosphatase
VARAALVAVACAVTALVAVGVIGLRWHYFTDTVGGAALGTGTVLTLAFLIDLVPGGLIDLVPGGPWGRPGASGERANASGAAPGARRPGALTSGVCH